VLFDLKQPERLDEPVAECADIDLDRFYIGSNVIDWPLQAMRGLADGHQICVHTWSHQ